MNHYAKFDAASFILGREIRNRTNAHTKKNKLVYRHVWTTKGVWRHH